MLSYPSAVSMTREFNFVAYQRDACVDGAPWRKPLLVVTPTATVGRLLSATCPGGHNHIVLRGPSPQGVPWTRVAAPYWPAWTRAIVAAWRPTLQRKLASLELPTGRPWPSDSSGPCRPPPPEIAGAGSPTLPGQLSPECAPLLAFHRLSAVLPSQAVRSEQLALTPFASLFAPSSPAAARQTAAKRNSAECL